MITPCFHRFDLNREKAERHPGHSPNSHKYKFDATEKSYESAKSDSHIHLFSLYKHSAFRLRH